MIATCLPSLPSHPHTSTPSPSLPSHLHRSSSWIRLLPSTSSVLTLACRVCTLNWRSALKRFRRWSSQRGGDRYDTTVMVSETCMKWLRGYAYSFIVQPGLLDYLALFPNLSSTPKTITSSQFSSQNHGN